ARGLGPGAEAMSARNGVVETLDRDSSAGIGVRALIGSSWGFFAIPAENPSAARRAGERAAKIPGASAGVPGPPLELTLQSPVRASWSSECLEDPWSVSLAEKGDQLVGVTRTMVEAGADIAEAGHRIWDTHKWLVTS